MIIWYNIQGVYDIMNISFRKKTLAVIVICLMMLMSLPVIMGSNEYFVENLDGNTLYVGGNGPGNYTTIQDAVDAASEGDTIFVYSGTYYENLQIDKTVTLTGEDKNNTVIDSNSSGNVVNVTADYVNINRFTIINSGFRDEGIYIYDSQDNSISDCIISSNDDGIALDLTKHALISNCIISSNKRFGVLIYASDGSRPHSNNNIISNCIISNNDEGIFLNDFNGNSIIGNNITGNHVYGIHLAFAANNIVKENNFIDNNRNAYFDGSFFNSWSKNYWDNWISFGPKIICGSLLNFIPLINFDWNPASEPYDVGGK